MRLLEFGHQPSRHVPLPRSDQEFQRFMKSKETSPFIGREDELNHMERFFSQAEPGKLKVAVIQGIPGSGKTQLAIQYAMQARVRCAPYKPVYIEASTVQIFGASLKRFLRLVRKEQETTPRVLKIWETQDHDILGTVRSKLEGASSQWTLVVDDITNDTYGHVQDLLPKVVPKAGRVILTTRLAHIMTMLKKGPEQHIRAAITIKGLKMEDAIQLLSASADPYNDRGIRDPVSNKRYVAVLEQLTCIPMLVQQLAVLLTIDPKLELPNPPTSAFIERVCQHHIAGTSTLGRLSSGKFISFFALFSPLLLQIRKEREVAADFLCLISFVHHERIDLESFIRAFTQEYMVLSLVDSMESNFIRSGNRFLRLQALLSHREELNVVLDMLASLGLFKEDSNTRTAPCFVNPMVQLVVRMALAPSPQSRLQWLKFALCAFQAGLLPRQIQPGQIWHHAKMLAPHLDALWEHCDEHGYYTATFCALSRLHANLLTDRGDYREAVRWMGRAARGSSKYGNDNELRQIHCTTALEFGLLYLRCVLAGFGKITWLEDAERIFRQQYRWRSENLGPGPETRDALKALVQLWVARKDVHGMQSGLILLNQQIKLIEDDNSDPVIEALQLKDVLSQAYVCMAQSSRQWQLLETAYDLSIATLQAKLTMVEENNEEIITSVESAAVVLWACYDCSGKVPNVDSGVNIAHAAVDHMKQAFKWRRNFDGAEHPETKRVQKTLATWKATIRSQKKATAGKLVKRARRRSRRKA